MIKLNRTTEYGLIALRHMSRKDGAAVTSAREVADQYGLPFEITAKTLQRLKDTGLIQSAQGAKGGYSLNRALKEVNLAEFLDLMEGQQGIVACAGETSPCEYHIRCGMSGPMNLLHGRVRGFLSGIKLDELTDEPAPRPLALAAGEEP